MDRNNEILTRHNRANHHKKEWLANTRRAVAKDLDIEITVLTTAVDNGNPSGRLTEEQVEHARNRIKYGDEQYALYMQDCDKALRRDYNIGHHALKAIVRRCEGDPVRRFLTMAISQVQSDRACYY